MYTVVNSIHTRSFCLVTVRSIFSLPFLNAQPVYAITTYNDKNIVYMYRAYRSTLIFSKYRTIYLRICIVEHYLLADVIRIALSYFIEMYARCVKERYYTYIVICGPYLTTSVCIITSQYTQHPRDMVFCTLC